MEKKQIQLNLDLELAKTNLQKAKDAAGGKRKLADWFVSKPESILPFVNRALFLSEKMNQALAKKDQDLAAAQKAADEKTALAEQKLASIDKLEEENAKLKTALDEANKEGTCLKKDKNNLN